MTKPMQIKIKTKKKWRGKYVLPTVTLEMKKKLSKNSHKEHMC